MTTREYINIEDVIAESNIEMGKNMRVAEYMCGRITPTTLRDLTLGQLMQLASARTDSVLVTAADDVFFGGGGKILDEDITHTIPFLYWLTAEVNKCMAQFSKVEVKPKKEEIMAGVERLNFGLFGIIDWYAQRMGITHEQAQAERWMVVARCQQMENEKTNYQRRLQDVYAKNN